jgi:hypothetical protein
VVEPLLVAGQDRAIRVLDLTYYDRHIAGNLAYQLEHQKRLKYERWDTRELDS